MEVEKRKNKRVTREEEESERVKKKRLKGEGEEEEEDDGGGDGAPTEEEVEEFFAILRRMKLAVKYFDDKGRGGREWREALETAELAVNHDGDAASGQEGDDGTPEKKGGEMTNLIEGFDLNTAVPEASEGGGG